MSRKVKIEYYTIEGYSLDFHKLIINFMPLCLCWITIPGSFLILRNMTPNSWQLTGATRSEVRLNGSELSWLLLQRRDKRGSTCPCEGDQWTLTGDWRLAPAKVRMEALQTERPSCYWASLGLRHTDWQLDIYCLVVIRHISIWLLAVQTCSHFNPQYNGKVGVELQKVMQFNASTFRSECTLAKYNVYHVITIITDLNIREVTILLAETWAGRQLSGQCELQVKLSCHPEWDSLARRGKSCWDYERF